MAGLLNLIPRYLPRFGMAPRWTIYARPLVLVLFSIDIIVTLIFKADVEAQGGAYATGVLVLMLSAAIAVALALWKESKRNGARELKPLGLSLYFWLITAVFCYTLIDNVIERPDGVIIASVFITTIVLLGAVSRYRRATELRVDAMSFADQESADLWPLLVGKRVNLVPLRTSTPEARKQKAAEVRRYYTVTGPLALLHVSLVDNRSEFLASLKVHVRREGNDFVVDISGAVAIANTIAYISELIDPISLFIGLTRLNLMTQALRYMLWGEGEIGLMVYTILLRYWDWTAEEDVRPLIFLMSE